MPQKDFHEWISEKAEVLTPSEVRLATHLVEHPEKWAFESASQLAALLDVHRSTIVRFAQNLGLSGFPELQAMARQALLNSFSPSIKLSLAMADYGLSDLVQEIFEREIQNLQETYRHLDAEALETTARGLAHAGKVVIFGRRFSYPIALYLSLAIKTMRDRVRLAPDPGGSSIDQLFDLTPEDYAIIVSLRRHSPEVQRALRFLAKAGIPRSLLTDVSPMTGQQDGMRVIRAHIGSTSVLESYTALISVCHTMLSLVHCFLPESQNRLEAVENAWSRFNKNK
ncbi:MAG: MurR/RpiR family transcriptional regulator [Deltaproteobacteria bacterium]|nr:MurR/RpiR family transcriptional regulator [Deltaproteobacteria bacterium]MBW2017674.1 MurR/RpiR family transcriptional regulator [Deltaproteobacteria bacterium]MBW2130156.1 MurR/RpiR family transcriptional regulator [Deltaproteobacteria bacterium]MBW2303032.1 MurR/RpiR family transcriptional regulator [Deltaproteobacteria bacterium]